MSLLAQRAALHVLAVVLYPPRDAMLSTQQEYSRGIGAHRFDAQTQLNVKCAEPAILR